MPSPLDPWPLRGRASRAPRAALALWMIVVAAASLEGVFARIEPEAYAALVAFAAGFTLLASWSDAELRETMDALPHKLATALMLDAVLLAALAISRDDASGAAAWTGFPAALGLLVLLPLALLAHAAAARAKALRTAPGASPGAKRAAT